MKKNIFAVVMWLLSFCMLIAAYFFWTKAADVLDAPNPKEETRITEKVQATSFYETYNLDGTIQSQNVEEYTIDTNNYIIITEAGWGSSVNSGDVICRQKRHPYAQLVFHKSGTVMEWNVDESGALSIRTEDLDNLKACFYVPQIISNHYSNGDIVEVMYNNKAYETTVSFLDNKMTEIEDADGNIKMFLYIETLLSNIEGVYINGEFSIIERICTASNVKVVSKSSIRYDEENAYVEVISDNVGFKKVYVELGRSDENMVEIISNEIHVGDHVLNNK